MSRKRQNNSSRGWQGWRLTLRPSQMALIPRRSGDAQNSPGRTHRGLSVTLSDIVFSSLEKILERSMALLEKKNWERCLDKSKDSKEVAHLVEEFRTAVVCYQVSGSYAV